MQISVIIPTLNEAASISGLVNFMLRFGEGAVNEVIVVDAESTDGTLEAAQQAGAKVVRCTNKSRASQMNMGARLATSEVLYFVHADVQLLPTFVQDIRQCIDDGADAGCYRYRFDSERPLLKVNAWCTRFDSLICRGGDQTLFIKKSLFEKIGRFNEQFTIMEDYDLIQRIQRAGTFKIIPKEIKVSARKYETNSWLRVQFANLMVFAMYRMGRSPDQMRQLYRQWLR